MRNYINKQKEAVNCYIIYSQDNRKVAHPPEICLQGAGATVVDKTAIQVTDSIKATKLILEKSLSRELVIYWYKAGNLNTNDYIKQQLKIAINRMLRKNSSGALIRLVTEIKGDNQDNKALSLLQAFAKQIEPLIQKYAP
jgi:EpsI family protein